jgi:PAS domain S-box-containing protein
MQGELKKSNERFSYVAKAVSDCFWDWDMETGQVYRSEALMALTGYTNQEIEGSLDWWAEKIHPKDRHRAMNKLHSFVKHGHSYCDAEYRFRGADDRYKYFSDKGYIIYQDGKPVRAIGVVHDRNTEVETSGTV